MDGSRPTAFGSEILRAARATIAGNTTVAADAIARARRLRPDLAAGLPDITRRLEAGDVDAASGVLALEAYRRRLVRRGLVRG